MKTILLAAAAVLAMPAIAQTTPAGGAGQASTPTDQGTSTAPAAGSASGGAADQQATPPADSSGGAMSGGTAPATGGQPMTTGGDASQQGAAPAGTQGGATAGGMASGAAPMTAEPAPAPLDHYPVCKKGQYDKCIEAGSAKGGSHHATHRRHK